MDLNEHIRHKELINLREATLSDWRTELVEEDEGEHPYVDIMPSSDEAQNMVKDAKKKKKKSKEEEETVEEGYKPMPHEANERQQARHRANARKSLASGDTDSANKSLDREAALKSPLDTKLKLDAKKEERDEKRRRALFSHTPVSEGKKPHSGADFAQQEREDAMRDHEVAMGRIRLDLGTHKKKKKKHVKEDYKELNKVHQRKQIDKLRDSAMSSDVEKSHELHDRADRATKTFISMDPEKLKDKCKNKKCSIDPKKK